MTETSPSEEARVIQFPKGKYLVVKGEGNTAQELENKLAGLAFGEVLSAAKNFAYVFYGDGLAVNVMYTVDDPSRRAVGFKLSEGMDVPKELEAKFKFARQKSKLAGTIRGSFFVIKGEY